MPYRRILSHARSGENHKPGRPCRSPADEVESSAEVDNDHGGCTTVVAVAGPDVPETAISLPNVTADPGTCVRYPPSELCLGSGEYHGPCPARRLEPWPRTRTSRLDERCRTAPRPGAGTPYGECLSDVGRDDARLELEQIGVVRVDRGAHPVGLTGAEGLDAREIREHAAARQSDRLVDLEVVRVAVH